MADDAKGTLIEPPNQLPINTAPSVWISRFRLRRIRTLGRNQTFSDAVRLGPYSPKEVTLDDSGTIGLRMGVKLRGDSTGIVFETVERHLSILADLDEVAVGITHVATPFPAVIV